MLKQNKIQEVKKLIENGFDLDLISFELDIPIQLLNQYKKEIDYYSKIKKMKGRYSKLFLKNDKTDKKPPKQLSEEELELIDAVILTVEQKIDEMKTLSKEEKRNVATIILSELKKIRYYQIPLEKAEKLYMLISSKNLQGLSTISSDKIDFFVYKQKRDIATQIAEAIEFKQYETNDIEELRALERKITPEMIRENQVTMGAIKRKISDRISAMRQQEAIIAIKTNISSSIISIITDLANGDIDIKKATAVIAEEAKKRVESNTQTKFRLTQEQERKQILIQITTAIRENPNKYHIQNPERMILQVQELCECELEQAVRTVVENLIRRKDFETARNICGKFSYTTKDSDLENLQTNYISGLKKQIINAEIGDIVLTMINMNGSPEEEIAYFELIEKALRMSNSKLEAISLGKSKDGLRNITLADIWKDGKTRND